MTAARAVSVVRQERIQDGRAAITLDEALGDVPGVFINNRYNFALGPRISLRGFGSRAAFGVRGIRLTMDGIPLTMPDGQSNLNNIDLTSVGRIEVLRGAASLLYGNAAGGAIDLHSETPRSGFKAEARALAANDYQRFNARVGGMSSAFGYLISAARAAGHGTRDHARFEQNNFTARLLRGASALTISVADAPVSLNPGSLPRDSAEQKPEMAWPRNVATGAGEKSRQLQAGVSHDGRIGSLAAQLSGFALTRTLDNPLPFGYITLERAAFGARAAFAYHALTVGLEAQRQRDQRAEFDNVAGRQGSEQRRDQTDFVTVVAPFARVRVQLGTSLSAYAGARYDRVRFEVQDRFMNDGRDDSGERTLSAFSPAVGVSWSPAPAGMFFVSLSTSFQTPTTTELINAPPASGAPCCAAGFNALDPERAVSVEAGYRGSVGPFTIDAALYHMTIDDAIVPFQVPQVEGRDFFRNAGRTRHRGLELAATARAAPSLTLTAAYTYSHFVFVDDGNAGAANEGHRLPGIAPHHLFLRAVARAGWLVVEPEMDVTSSYYADDANSEVARNQGAAILNLRLRTAAGLAAGRLRPFVALNNATDRRYSSSVVINAAGGRYFEPAPGRNFLAGLEIRAAAGP